MADAQRQTGQFKGLESAARFSHSLAPMINQFISTRTTSVFCAATLGWLALSCGSAALQAAEAKDLFNAKDLTGWRSYLSEHQVGTEDVWSVRDGLLICKGEPMGYIYTKQDFTNFRLLVEWRWAPGKEPGNSGVLMRINGEPKPLPRSLESQLRSGDAGDLYGFHGMSIRGEDAKRAVSIKAHPLGGDLLGVRKMEGAEVQPGEWNRMEVLLQGPNVKVWVNGKLVNEAADCEVIAGPIGLQSEGGEVHFRKVQLTPLEP
jgi:hypothetical protein